MYYFVGGYPRTGTTLVGNLLCGDKRTNDPIAEVSYLEYMMFPYEAFIAGWERNYTGLFEDEDEFYDMHRGFIEQFLEHLRVRHECEHLVVKRPFLTRWFPTLAQMFKDARFIICIRDPRDVIGSLKMVKRRHERLTQQEQNLNPYLDQNLVEFAYGYTQGIMECRRGAKQNPDRFHFVVYEELVREPERSMEILGKALDLELELPTTHWEKFNEYVGTNPFHSKGWGKSITTQNVGKYKSQLDQDEIQMVETICAIIMEGFGYEKETRR